MEAYGLDGLNIGRNETVVPAGAPEKGHKNGDRIGDSALLQVRKNCAERAELRPFWGYFIVLYQYIRLYGGDGEIRTLGTGFTSTTV